jgi:hypothetical protein
MRARASSVMALGGARRGSNRRARGSGPRGPELVELRQPEHVGAVDEHRVGARDVEAALDDGRGAEHVVAALDEVEHALFSSSLSPASLSCPWRRDARVRDELGEPRGPLVEALDAVVDVEDLPPRARARGSPPRAAPASSEAGDEGADRPAIAGGVVMSDMSRRPATAIWSVRGMGVADSVSTSTSSQLLDALLVGDAEALLLVDDEQAELLEVHVLRESRWVPITTSTLPSLRSRITSSCSLFDWKRDSARTTMG